MSRGIEIGRSAERIRSTTVVAVLRDGQLALVADGQVTLGDTVMKQTAEKVRRVAKGRAIVGFAGGVADALRSGPAERMHSPPPARFPATPR
jgi:ATP-dependent HslUV protease subunit HslV